MPKHEPLFEAAQIAPEPVPAAAAAEPVLPLPGQQAPPRFRHIERNQPTWMVVDLERMLDESHPARSVWDFVGGLDLSLFEENVKVRKGGAGRDSWPPRLLISMWIYAYTRGISFATRRLMANFGGEFDLGGSVERALQSRTRAVAHATPAGVPNSF